MKAIPPLDHLQNVPIGSRPLTIVLGLGTEVMQYCSCFSFEHLKLFKKQIDDKDPDY